ncbi:MAG: patatin-like phospholipase family protein [Anaerolineae bacterium]|nr:patatin-like phospholipase family protein [Anaerolineae bacterium]
MTQHEKNRRAIVVSGGGAKGVFEAGVLYAMHRIGFVDFDIVTGASAGSLNGGFFAEYVMQWKELTGVQGLSPAEAQRALEPMVERLLYMWTHVTDWGVLDFSEGAALRRMVQALSDVELSLPMAIGAWWALTSPRAGILAKLLAERMLGGRIALRAAAQLVKEIGVRQALALSRDLIRRRLGPPAAVSAWDLARPYVRRYIEANAGPETSLWRAVVPVDVMRGVLICEAPRLGPGLSTHPGPPRPLIDADRRFSAYRRLGLNVRFTRTNLRTGYLEVSAFVTVDEFIYDLADLAAEYQRQREADTPIDFLATRVRVPGDPKVVDAAIASSAYPGMVEPIPIDDIYPRPDAEARAPAESANADALLYLLLARDAGNLYAFRGLGDRASALVFAHRTRGAMLQAAVDAPGPDALTEQLVLVNNLLPLLGDHYIDGGVIDNTPTRSTIDAARDSDARGEPGFRDLDVFVVFLNRLPREAPITAQEMAAYLLVEIGMRALFLQGQADKVSDVTMQAIISRLLGRLRRVDADLEAAVGAVDELLAGSPSPEAEAALQALRARLVEARTTDLPQHWIRTEMFTIFPSEIVLNTVAFHERFGFSTGTAARGVALGCAETLEKLYVMLRRRVTGEDGKKADAHERAAFARLLALAGQPEDTDRRRLLENWRCTFRDCVFWARHCAHGGR